MKLHLPLPLRTALLSAFVSFIGFSSVAQGEKISGCYSSSSGGVKSAGDILWSDYDRLVLCYNESTGNGGCFYSNHYGGSGIRLLNNGYLYFHHNRATYGGALGGEPKLIHNNGRVVFKYNVATNTDDRPTMGVVGGGAIQASSGVQISNNDSVSFSLNYAPYSCGGAIAMSGYSLLVSDCGGVNFSNNEAKTYGGAISMHNNSAGWFNNNYTIATFVNNKNITFLCNSVGKEGGAIYTTRYVDIQENERIEFSGNCAGEYGGAIRSTGCTSYGSGNGGCLFIDNNGDVIFRDNYAGIAGGAIYATGGLYSAYIRNNENVIFENNVGGAIYSEHAVVLRGNEEVLFKGNGVAIDTDSEVSLSTTESEHSSIRIYDSIRSGG